MRKAYPENTKKVGHTRQSQSSLIRKQQTLHKKKMQVRGLEGLLEEWESFVKQLGEWNEEHENYIRHVKSKLNAAKNNLKGMGGV